MLVGKNVACARRYIKLQLRFEKTPSVALGTREGTFGCDGVRGRWGRGRRSKSPRPRPELATSLGLRRGCATPCGVRPQAEGARFELATPCGAPHFQDVGTPVRYRPASSQAVYRGELGTISGFRRRPTGLPVSAGLATNWLHSSPAIELSRFGWLALSGGTRDDEVAARRGSWANN